MMNFAVATVAALVLAVSLPACAQSDTENDAETNAAEHVDRLLSPGENKVITGSTAEAFEIPGPREKRPTCVLPEASRDAEIVTVKGVNSEALSTVALGDINRTTYALQLEVERGDVPLYLVLNAINTALWTFDGAVERVEKVVVQQGLYEPAGVAGLPAEKVVFVPKRACIEHVELTRSGIVPSSKPDPELNSALGRAPDHVLSYQNINKVAVPSGEVLDPDGNDLTNNGYGGRSPEFTGRQSESVRLWHPSGVIEINPDEVVSEGHVVAYDVLPEAAGLQQLIDEGRIRKIGTGRHDHDRYEILKPFPRIPAGLSGARSVEFVLPAGIPVPEVARSHSVVIRAETGECIAGRLCPEYNSGD
ncbi:hypothetical protein [Henriciella aquimarina]|uniref:hypothetical protein n=1 Tax=Henriciella aquimarina TaxID=545261 RepID=UPI000A0229E8|nr:hypothetical protein [Henriciella aquimarina]